MKLSDASLLAFERQGHWTSRGILPASRVRGLQPVVAAAAHAQRLAAHKQKVRVLLGEEAVASAERKAARAGDDALLEILRETLEGLPGGSIPFLQSFNLWRTSRELAALAACPELAGTASALLGGAPGVRLYQDSLFVKRPDDGPTHWHSDLAMAPLDTNRFVTVWLPLQPVPAEEDGGSGLVFASGSHRDVALHFWHGCDPAEAADASHRGYAEASAGALQVGDATWHHGWTLHCASPNALRAPREALAFSFFADGATRLERPQRAPHAEDSESYAAWLGDVKPGKPARHAMLPLVWKDGRPVGGGGGGGAAGGARSARAAGRRAGRGGARGRGGRAAS